MNFYNLLYGLVLLLLNVVKTIDAYHLQEFWTTMEIKKIDWKENCLTEKLCPKMSRLHISLGYYHLRQEVNLPIYEEIAGQDLSFYWTNGFPEDIQISSGVYGIFMEDPNYNFPRKCDSTLAKTIFSMKDKDSKNVLQNEATLILQAECYNVTVLVKKFTERCPWCLTEKSSMEQQSASFENNDGPIVLVAVVAIAIVSGVLLMACYYCKKGSNMSNISINSSLLYSPQIRKPFIFPSALRIPSPPSSAIPSPPYSAAISSTFIRNDEFYEQIAESSINQDSAV